MFLYFLTVSHIEEDKQGRNANGGPHNGLMLSYLFFPRLLTVLALEVRWRKKRSGEVGSTKGYCETRADDTLISEHAPVRSSFIGGGADED